MTSVRKLEIRIDQTGNATKAIGRLAGSLGTMGAVAGGVAVAGIGLSTAAIVKLGSESAKTAGNFEEQMNILEVAAGRSGTSFEDLSEVAIKVGGDIDLVGINASQSADAMTNFYKAGLETSDIFEDLDGYLAGNVELTGALRSAIDLASASELELAQSSEVVAIAMATFGMDASQTTQIVDSFVAAADASVASVPELADALVTVGPTAAGFGWDLETVNTALAIMSERGIRGSEAGTALKSMMTNLQRPTKAVVATLAELNVNLFTADGVMKDLPVIMAELEASMAGMTEEQQLANVQTLAGTYGMRAMHTLLAEGKVGWDEMTVSIAAGASAKETAAARTKGYNAAIEQMRGSIESLMIRAGTPLIEKFLTPAIKLFTEWLPTLEQTGRDALPIINDALTRMAQAFGASNEEVDWADVLLKGLELTLQVIITAIELAAVGMYALSHAVKAVSDAIRWLTDKWGALKDLLETPISLPSWITPGSPTPFELGLRGIGSAMDDLNFGKMVPSGGGAPAGMAGGGGITVNLIYSPVVSLADRYEAEEKLAPFIATELRKLGVVA